MESIWGNVIVETAPGVDNKDISWMIPFWESFTDCVIELDASHNIKYIRRRADSSFTLSGIAGKPFLDITKAQDIEMVASRLEELKTASVTHLRFRCLSILDKYYRWTLVPYYLDDGEYSGCHGVAIDVTANIEQEKKLEEARRAAEAANVAKSEFLSRMSHEIRTPMNAIIGMINIGLDTEDIHRKDYCLSRADDAAKHLLRLINDILDMSKIEADKLELSESLFSLDRALKNITNLTNVRADEKQLKFVVNIGPDVPSFIVGDEMRLSQVITNLLTNAMKFTPEKGTVTLDIEKLEETGDIVVLKIEVTDTGIGISEDQRQQLFSSFNQANADISQKYGGTGLGLAISKRIVELMGGEIWLESELGKGSKFIFTLLTKKVEARSGPDLYGRINLRGLRILMVDDSEESREYFTHTMDSLNLRSDIAPNGFEAMKLIKESAGDPYDMFFIDWQMPDMDGIELTRKIKELGSNGSVIMVSAYDCSDVRQEALAAGVNHFIAKPLLPALLTDAINTCLGAELYDIADVRRDTTDHTGSYRNHTILIAEDIEINREIMTAVLEKTGVHIDYAENGRVATAMFYANPGKYSLILMDINMPDMNGYEATRKIRSLGTTEAKGIPIIAMTANVFKEDIDKCLAAGMDGHTGKPIDADELFEKLNQYLF